MDKDSLKYQFQKTRQKAGKLLSNEAVLVGSMGVLMSTLVAGFVVTAPLDDNVTEKTPQVMQDLQQRFDSLTSQQGDVSKNDLLEYTNDLLLADDLSEKQTNELLSSVKNNFTGTFNKLNYKIGNVGDLRECRSEVGTDNVKDIAACTIDKSSDDKMFFNIGNGIWATLFIIYIFGNGREKFPKWAEEKPRDPKFKH